MCTHVGVHACMYVYMHVCVCGCGCVCLSVCLCMCMCAHVCAVFHGQVSLLIFQCVHQFEIALCICAESHCQWFVDTNHYLKLFPTLMTGH